MHNIIRIILIIMYTYYLKPVVKITSMKFKNYKSSADVLPGYIFSS